MNIVAIYIAAFLAGWIFIETVYMAIKARCPVSFNLAAGFIACVIASLIINH